MEIDVSSAAVARSVEIRSAGAGSSPCSAKREHEPHTIALSASIERVLVTASFKASERLKRRWPKFSAATYNRFANVIPFLIGALSFAAILTTPATIVLSTIVVLPIAFRLSVAARSAIKTKENLPRPTIPNTPNEELPIYTVIAPLRGEARMVDQLLSAIEALDYPAEKL